MATYSVNLPLQQEALQWATNQGVALGDFILWAVTEKIVEPKHSFSDRTFPNVVYCQGASSQLVHVVAGTGIRVQTILEIGRQ